MSTRSSGGVPGGEKKRSHQKRSRTRKSPKTRITFREISELSGVSVGTVDRAIHGRAGIQSGTRERVLAAAKELGYRPHLLARGLATGSTMTIGVVLPNLRNSFFSELAEVIQKGARRAGYFVYLMLSEYDQQQEMESLERLHGLSVDGIIMSPVSRGRAFESYLAGLATPVVTVNNRVSKGRAWVGIDDCGAAADAVKLVLGKNYRRVIYVTEDRGPGKVSNLYCDEERVRGYHEALARHGSGMQPVVMTDTQILALLESGNRMDDPRTCIACSCDEVALTILNGLKRHGLRVPEDIGLTGFDNLDLLAFVAPRLTTVAYPIEQIGEAAFQAVLVEIGGAVAQSRVLAHSVISGETV